MNIIKDKCEIIILSQEGDLITNIKGVGKEEDFKMDENDLRDEADKLSKEYEYIDNVPVVLITLNTSGFTSFTITSPSTVITSCF